MTQTYRPDLQAERHRVRAVGADEAGLALAILVGAARWSARFGEPIWPPDSFSLAEHLELATAGELFGGFYDGAMRACMRLQPKDALLWPDDPPGEALYVHKVAVDRDAAGKGWTSRLIDFAVSRASDAGALAVRLDTVPVPRMVALYQDLGFRTVDDGPGTFAGRRLVRLERRLAERAPARPDCGSPEPTTSRLGGWPT